MGPRAGLDRRKNLVPTRIRSRTVQPIVSRYTNSATRSTGYLLIMWMKIRTNPLQPSPFIIIIIIISFMHGIYTYIPETNYVPTEYSVAAILLLLFMVLISLVSVLNLLYFYISTFRSMCAVPNVAVFCSSFTSCFPGMLLTYFLNDFEIVPFAPIITGITFVFTFHMRCVYIVRSLHFRIFPASFLITLLLLLLFMASNLHVFIF